VEKIPARPVAGLGYVIANLLLLPGLFSIVPMISVARSLSSEMFYYLALPLSVSALRLRKATGGTRVFAVLSASALYFGYTTVTGAGHVRLLMFTAGILICELESIMRPRTLSVAAVAAILMSFAFWWVQAPGVLAAQGRFLSIWLAYLFLCRACIRQTGFLARTLSGTPARWLGNISYSYVLLHGLSLRALFWMLPAVWAPSGSGRSVELLLLPVAFAWTLLPTALLYLLVEYPLSISSNRSAHWSRLAGALRWRAVAPKAAG